jgi:hypothetical protein
MLVTAAESWSSDGVGFVASNALTAMIMPD